MNLLDIVQRMTATAQHSAICWCGWVVFNADTQQCEQALIAHRRSCDAMPDDSSAIEWAEATADVLPVQLALF